MESAKCLLPHVPPSCEQTTDFSEQMFFHTNHRKMVFLPCEFARELVMTVCWKNSCHKSRMCGKLLGVCA